MSVPAGYTVNEKFGESIENQEAMTNLSGDPIEQNLYGKMPTNPKEKLQEAELEEEENPDDVLSALEDDEVVVEREVEGENNEEPEEKNIEKENADTEHCVFGPTIDSCIRPGGLTPEEGKEAKIALTGLEEGADPRAALKKANISTKSKNKLGDVVEYMNKPETKEKNKENFLKDFGIKLEDFKEDNIEGEKKFGALTQLAIDRLGSNYFVNTDTEGFSLDSSEALEKAFKTSIVEISLKADETTIAYKEIVNDILDGDKSFEERFKRLVALEDYTNTEIVKGGKKNKEDLVAANKRNTKNNNAAEAFQNAQGERSASEAELLANNRALEESVLSQPEEVGGDIFAVSEIDVAKKSVST